MSDFSKISTCSGLSVSNSKVTDLIAITETLNKAARLLLDFGREQELPEALSWEFFKILSLFKETSSFHIPSQVRLIGVPLLQL